MPLPDARTLAIDPAILVENNPHDPRLILWAPGRREGDSQIWERISSVAGGQVLNQDGLCSIPATAFTARQHVGGFVGKLLKSIKRDPRARDWQLPNGQHAEETGQRRANLVLVWSEGAGTPLTEERIRARWPEQGSIRRLGGNLYVVEGFAAAVAEEAPPQASMPSPPPPERTREEAEQILVNARDSRDGRRIALALVDVALAYKRQGDPQRAAAALEESLAMARQLGDRALESDAQGNLAMVLLELSHPQRALDLFHRALDGAQAAGDRMAEKMALDRLGSAYSGMRDHRRALDYYQQALAIARAVGDRQQESDLLWYLAIQHAELGRHEAAAALGREAVQLKTALGDPEAEAYADHLEKYQKGEGDGGLTHLTGGVYVAQPGEKKPASGPGVLRMALTAAQAITKFVSSGLRTTTGEVYRKRVDTCSTCEHFTGLRCRVCGCFVSTKARLPHEVCPIGKWPGKTEDGTLAKP